MTATELARRLNLAHLALGAAGPIAPENTRPTVVKDASGTRISPSFQGGASEQECYLAIMSIVDMVVGSRDRTKGWLKKNGRDPNIVDAFVKSHDQVALVHDLGNLDKHGSVGRSPLFRQAGSVERRGSSDGAEI